MKIAMIGAGSIGFTKSLVTDILTVQELQDTEFRFMDIDEESLEMSTNLCSHLIKSNHFPAQIIPTTNRREAVKDADYVFCTIRVGGLEAYQYDIEIPLKYGVRQCIGDTLGPGGILYALRTIPQLLDLAQDIRELAPDALLMNYANPMAMNMWALRRAGGIHAIGLCHGVQHTHAQIANALHIPKEELDYVCAGINHQTWFIELMHKGQDMRPHLLKALEQHPKYARQEKCRIDVLRRFGYYSTESNGHLSEYLPWYRKDEAEISRWIDPDRWIGGRTGAYLEHCRARQNNYKETYQEWLKGNQAPAQMSERTVEHGSYIIEALETGRMYRGHFNVENRNMITNLPNRCTIELPGYVDRNGIHPIVVGDLPMACAATCRSSISVQEMTVEAALTGNRELVKLAILHDPLTAAVCTTDQVWRMADEMLDATSEWLPQFNGENRKWQDISGPDSGKMGVKE